MGKVWLCHFPTAPRIPRTNGCDTLVMTGGLHSCITFAYCNLLTLRVDANQQSALCVFACDHA